METRKTLLACALAVAASSCSDAVAPPASMGMTVNLFGDLSVKESVPGGNESDANQINLELTAEKLEMLELAKDGDDGMRITCSVKELAPGTSYQISATYIDKTQTTQISLSATTMANASAGGYVSIKSAATGNQTYAGDSCTVDTVLPKETGGAIVARFRCDPSPLIHQENCGDPTNCDDTLLGDILFYVKDCDK